MHSLIYNCRYLKFDDPKYPKSYVDSPFAMHSIFPNPKTLNWVLKLSPRFDQSDNWHPSRVIAFFVIIGWLVVLLIPACYICCNENMNFLGLLVRSIPSIEMANCRSVIDESLEISSDKLWEYVMDSLFNI